MIGLGVRGHDIWTDELCVMGTKDYDVKDGEED